MSEQEGSEAAEQSAPRRAVQDRRGLLQGAVQDRRGLLQGAATVLLGGAGAAVVAGCGSSGKAPVATLPEAARRRDVQLLMRALDLERRTVAAYTAGIPLLTRFEARAAKQFLDEELEHTGELIGLLKTAGAEFPPRRSSYYLGHPRNGAEVLSLLHELERDQVALYLTAIPRLSPGPMRAAAASILAADAQHVAVLRLQQGLDPTPSALVSGSE